MTKLSLRNVPNPHTNQILYEAEVWVKDARGRRKLDLMVKYPTPHSAPAAVASGVPLSDNITIVLHSVCFINGL